MRTLWRSLAVLALLSGSAAAPRPARAAPALAPAAGHTYTVNSTLDQPDADPSDGVCAGTPSGKCTLRAALMESNFVTGPNTILVPSGTYNLTRAGYDDGALVGDLDIQHNVTIQGAGPGLTIIDGNGAVTGDRVFDVRNTTTLVTLQGLTIRGGNRKPAGGAPYAGGGVYAQGHGELKLTDVILEDNTAG